MISPRLTAFVFSGAIALVAAGGEFWDQTEPRYWTPAQVDEMLTRSPWVKQASISFFNNGPGGYGAGIGGLGGAGLGGRTGGGQRGANARAAADKAAGAAATNPGTFHAVVRWDSSTPVQAALKSKTGDFPSGFYVLSLIGDIPDFARPNDEESTSAREQRVQMLRESTKLERRGGPIYLDHIESIANGTRFYFSRLEPITAGNKEVTFMTKMGPLEIKAKFLLKEMMYRGKLEL